MKFHDIPDLPIRAFMHNGIKSKICLYKGGGDVIDWAKDQLDETPILSNPSDVLPKIEGPLQWVSDQLDETPVVSNPGETFATIDDAVNDNVPGGWVTVGAAALGGAGALGAFGAGVGAAAEGSELAALQADAAIQSGLAAEAGAGTGVGAGVGAGVAGADAVMPGALAGEIAGEGTAQLGSGTSLSASAGDPLSSYYATANPTAQANLGTVSNLVGGGAESNLATLGTNPLLPTTGAGIGGSELGATGSIIGTGEGLGTQTLTDTLAPTGLNGLTVNDLNSQPLLNNDTTSTTSAKDIADALRKANQLKNLLSSNQQLVKNQQTLQQSQALGNLLKTNQFTPMAIPPIYKAQNPFSFGQQEPIQGNPLVSLLRNNYGNS